MTIILKSAIDKISSQMRIFDLQRFSQQRQVQPGELETIINDTSEIREYLKSNNYQWTSGYSNLHSQISELSLSEKAKYAEFLLMLSGSTLAGFLKHTTPLTAHDICDIALKITRIATSVIKDITEEYPSLTTGNPYSLFVKRDEKFTRAYEHIDKCPSSEQFEDTLKHFEVSTLSIYWSEIERGTEDVKIVSVIPDMILSKRALGKKEDYISAAADLATLAENYSIQPLGEEVPIKLIELAEILTAKAEEQLFEFQRLVEQEASTKN